MPNVLVISANALHLGFLGTYGNPWIETPNLDRLAAEGVVFDQHFADNLTTIPTRRSWWTGRYGFADPDQGWGPLDPETPILPDFLAASGIRSIYISDVPYLREPGLGFGRGFDEVIWIRGSGYDPYIPPTDPRAAAAPAVDAEPGLPLPPDDDPDRPTWIDRWARYLRNRAALGLNRDPAATNVARSIDSAIGWLERHATHPAEPFVLWLDLFCPHGPWDPPPPYRDLYATIEPDTFETDAEGDIAPEMLADEAPFDLTTTRVLIDVPPGLVGDVLSETELLRLRRTYAGCISLLDAQLGRLLNALDRLGRLDDTLILFTADQGEPLGEHGFVRRFRPWLYEELIHTPLILRMPRAECGGRRHRALVQPVDLLPTILEAVGAAAPADVPPLHGASWLPLVRGESSKLRDYACLGMDLEEFAIRTHHWHLIVPLTADPDDPPRSVELYRKPEDRWDQNNVVDQYPELADHLELALRRFAEATRHDSLDQLPPLREIARLGPAD
jgi:arylsulfatase A-like enzyme